MIHKQLPEGFLLINVFMVVFHHFEQSRKLVIFKHHMMAHAGFLCILPNETWMQSLHVGEIRRMMFVPKCIETFAVTDKACWFKEKHVSVQRQISIQDTRNHTTSIQFDELL